MSSQQVLNQATATSFENPTAVAFTDGSDIGLRFVTALANMPIAVVKAYRENPATIPEVDYIFSCWYDKRIPGNLLSKARKGGVNIHPAYLPFNRGRHSAFWAIMEGTPMGATLHWMDSTLDTGDIIAQEAVQDDGIMTAQEVYDRQVALCFKIWSAWVPRIIDGTAPRVPQVGMGTNHLSGEIRKATEFQAWETISMSRLLQLCRATSFGDSGFYVIQDGRKFKIRAEVTECVS